MNTETLYFETENSVYFMDVANRRYSRFARRGTKDQPIFSDRLTYATWHTLQDIDTPFWEEGGRLRILEETSEIGLITSPIVSKGKARDYQA